jgi:hypothetical protein
MVRYPDFVRRVRRRVVGIASYDLSVTANGAAALDRHSSGK